MLVKNASVSSSSTSHAQIMTEMRNKLIDIQNNKQYIEQKIQEYEKKLQQLKGTSSSLVLGAGPYGDRVMQRSGSGMLLQSNRGEKTT